MACVTTPWWVEIIVSQASHVLLIMKCLDQTRYTAAANVHKLFAASCFLSHVPGSAPLFLQKALMARHSRWDCVKRTQAIYKRYKISPRSGCLAYFFVYVCLCSTCKSNSTAVWKSQNMSRFKDFICHGSLCGRKMLVSRSRRDLCITRNKDGVINNSKSGKYRLGFWSLTKNWSHRSFLPSHLTLINVPTLKSATKKKADLTHSYCFVFFSSSAFVFL